MTTVHTMHPRDQLADRIRAHLDSLEAAEPACFETDASALALAAAGDAIRIGVSLPPRLSRWLGGLSRQKLTAACGLVVEELDETLIPAGDDPMLEAAVGARDRAESARAGALRSCVSKRWIPHEVDGYRRLHDACGRFDATLFLRANREAIALALGDRVWLDDGPRWYDGAPASSEAAHEEDGEVPAVPLSAPPIAIVSAYLTEGLHHRWVETVARYDEDFAVEIESTIEAGLATGEPIGFVARRWLSDRGARHAFVLGSSRRLAAADEQVLREIIELGRLAPLNAVARIVLERGAVFEVDADAGAIASVALGDRCVTSPDPDGAWRIAIDRWEGPVALRVTSPNGDFIEADLELGHEDPA